MKEGVPVKQKQCGKEVDTLQVSEKALPEVVGSSKG